ncbi:MAG: DNA polymerase III subunit beta [bacterium]|nr:DNA polymerase III subunit beta [bacterium]
MKFSCTQENLNRGLQIVGHIANRNVNLPILQNVLIQAKDGKISLSSTNLEIGVRVSIRGKIEEEGEFTLPAQLLSSYINVLTTERIDCILNGKEFNIIADEQNTVVKGEMATEFPILPEVEKVESFILNRELLERALQQVVIAASFDETRPEIAGVLFDFTNNELILAATDSYRLAEKKIPVTKQGKEIKVILPQRSAQELLRVIQATKEENVIIYASETQLACEMGEIEFVSRVIEGNFPDYHQIIPQQGNTTISLVSTDLITAVKGAALFSKTGINDVKLSFSKEDNTVSINAVNAQLGENTTKLSCVVEGQDNTAVFNYRYLLDGLQQVQKGEVEIKIIDSISPGVFRGKRDETYTYVIMPIKQ